MTDNKRVQRRDMAWNGDTLHRKGSSRPLMSIERDSTYPNMWRVRRPNGTLSDMVNRTRAKDAAELMVLASNLKMCRTPSEDSRIRQTGGPATLVAIVPENKAA
jgi:hypothetical protein